MTPEGASMQNNICGIVDGASVKTYSSFICAANACTSYTCKRTGCYSVVADFEHFSENISDFVAGSKIFILINQQISF